MLNIREITSLLEDLNNSKTLPTESKAIIVDWVDRQDEPKFIEGLTHILNTLLGKSNTGASFTPEGSETIPLLDQKYFRDVPLPGDLTLTHLKNAMEDTQDKIHKINLGIVKSTGFPLSHFIQSNNFSGIVSNVFTDSLDNFSPYKHNHDQRFPDLKNPATSVGIEIKAANKPGKGAESHNGHEGWHLIASYDLNEISGDICFSHIQLAELISHQTEKDGDWHYCGSSVSSETGSQRTETYYTTSRGGSKLRDGSAFINTNLVTNWKAWQHSPDFPIPRHSPLYFNRFPNTKKVPSLNNPERDVLYSGVKPKLFKINPLWPLMDASELISIGIPEKLAKLLVSV